MIIRRSASLEKLHFSKRKSLFNLKNACGNRKGKCEENSWEKLHQIKSRAQVHVFDTIEVVHIKSILILVRGLISCSQNSPGPKYAPVPNDSFNYVAQVPSDPSLQLSVYLLSALVTHFGNILVVLPENTAELNIY